MGQPLPPPQAPPPQALPPPVPMPHDVAAPPPGVRRRPEPLPPLEGRSRTLVRAEMVVMGFMLAVPSLVFGLQGLGEARQIEVEMSYLELAARVLSAFGPAVLCGFLLWRDGILRQTMFARRSAGFTLGWGSLTLACIFGTAIVGGVLVTILQDMLGSDAASNVEGDADLTLRYGIVAVALSITAGVTEEAVWRGYGAARMEQAGFPRLALLVPSGVWVLLHIYGGPYTLLMVTFIGAPLVWMAWWKRSVWPLMLAHSLWDVFAFLIATVD